ncbi:arylsulfatase [Kitasatospora sp. NPDC088783]|uniref:arylsulfatase n=1 Tax=Kitasatospora sp. NPDC088783 TaxID=3364077 RepID=UPI0037FF2F2C
MPSRNPSGRSTTGPSRRALLAGAVATALAGLATAPGATAAPAAATAPTATAPTAGGRRPNILLIVLDDLGWNELGCYGQRVIRTPVVDRLAAEGVRFTQAYANPSCAPTRASLLTGRHTGHSRVKSNADAARGLAAEDVTVGEVLHAAGYATGLVGKWGLGPDTGDSPSHPNRQGFDHFFGYIDQVHAQDYWPTYLWRNGERVDHPENEGADVTYAVDLFTREALDFIDRHQDGPFFLSLNYNTPHAPNEIPDDAPYSAEPWPQGERNHAAQITYTDTRIGTVLDRLAQRGLADDTLVVFVSDNGPHAAGAHFEHVGSTLPHDPEFFDSNGPLRGIKFSVYEGGVRVPLIVRLPASLRTASTPKPGTVLRDRVAVWDFLPTLAEFGGGATPPGLDGVSFRRALTGPGQPARPPLYWRAEDGAEAVRFGRWKGVRPAGGPVELYDVFADIGERSDVATAHPDLVGQAERLLADAVAGG